MTRFLLGSAFGLIVTLFAGQSAHAQHYSGGYGGGSPGYASYGGSYGGGYGGSYGGGYGGYSRPHVDAVPGQFVPHRGHFDYVPQHNDLHVGGRRYEISPYSGGVSPFPHRRH